MRLLLFTVFDSAARRFLAPFEGETIESAIRSFRAVVNQDGHQFNRFPEDYTLFVVGEFSGETGLLEAYETPRSLGVAVTFLQPAAEPVSLKVSHG